MGDMFNKQVDLSGIVKTIQDEVSKIHDVSENAGEAVGEGFNIGMEESAKQIQASSIKLESSFKKLGEKIKKQAQQLSTSIQGNPIKLKIDFSDVDMDSKRIQNRIQKLMKEFDTEELVHYDTKQSRQQFQDLITLSIKYDEKLSLLRKSMQDLKTPQDTLKNLQQQYILVKQIGDIYNFLDKQTDKMLPSKMPSAMFDSYELSSAIKMLSDFTNGVQAAESKMDFSGVVQQLEEIKKIINELKIAFEPLTNAFTDGDNALSKMVTTSITDLDKLIQKFNELYQMVDTISNKQFNVNNIISNGNNTQNDLDQIRQFRKEAKELYSQVQDLYVESATTGNKIKSTPWGFNEVLNFSRIMGDFDFNDLGKRIKSRSAASLAIVVDELAEWKRILLQFNELRNKTEAGSFDSSKYKSTVSKTDNTTTSKKGTESVVDESVIDDNDILNKVKILSEQVMAEFASIRNKMEEVFDFSTLNFNDEFIKSQIEQIYQQFVELQSKINALDFSITSSDIAAPKDPKQDKKIIEVSTSDKTTDSGAEDIRSATEAIKEEGDAAELAAKQKEEFVEANKNVAQSGTKTKAGVKEATEAIEEEGEAAEDSAKRIAMVQQANSSFETANKANIGDVVKLRGLSQADFELYAQEVAKSKGLTVDDISVRMGENGNMMVASVRMVNEELAQSVTYTYKLMELEEGLVDAYLTGYIAKGNQNKALKIAAAQQKKADAERLKADKAKAKNNQWLIQQQSKLDTQERKYKYSNKSIDGSTSLMSTETSLADGVDKTIDSLTRHIKERIKLAMADGLTDDLKESILNDLRILQNEISVAQSVEYSATNMKASSVETNKKAYAEYLNAFEANAKKANVFEQMEDDIKSLRTELEKVSDSASMDQFIDNLKVARNKLQAEKAQYTAQEKESQAQQKQEQKQLKQLIADYKEYANIIERIQILINKSNLTGEDYSQAIFGLQSSANEKAAKMLNTYGVDVTSQDNLLDSLSKNNILTQEQMNTLLEEDIKHREKIVQLVREASDAETNASNKKYAQEQKNQNKQAQNYGKTQYNRELKYLETINAKATALEKDSGVSKLLNNKIQEYKNVFTRLENLRNTFSSDPKAFNNDRLKNDFQSAALEAENLRKEILGIFKESQKLANIPSDSLLGIKEINDLNLSEAKQEMINFIAEITDGQFKFEGFNAAGTEMYGVLDKGNGIIENVTIALDRGTNSLYAYQTGTKQVSNSWQKLGSTLKEGVMRLAGQYIGFHELFQQIRNGITSVKDIDLALTELKKVTDETDATYKRFLKDMAASASVVGSTTKNLTNSAADWARLGYSIKDAGELAKNTAVLMNVSEFDNVNDATEALISSLQAFGYEASNSIEIVDKLNIVGNNFAISTQGAAEGLKRSAATLVAAGNSLEESLAMLAAGNKVMQDPEALGKSVAENKNSYIG